MRCALLVLLALLKVQALRTESIDFAPRKNAGIPRNDKDTDTQMSQPLVSEMQEWSGLPTREEALKRMINVDTDEEDDGEDFEFPDEQFKSIEQLDDKQLGRLSNYLYKVLQRPDIYEAPMLLLKDPINESNDRTYPMGLEDSRSVAKRSRYYRRYPWKRQNSRTYQPIDYDPYNTCNPTRKDVFQLLLALHDARQGNKSRIVNFCNRKRPASAVYTNIRFLGRRRK